MTASVTKRDYPKTHIPALECARLGLCYLCHGSCKVVRLPPPHITVPWCGCTRVRLED